METKTCPVPSVQFSSNKHLIQTIINHWTDHLSFTWVYGRFLHYLPTINLCFRRQFTASVGKFWTSTLKYSLKQIPNISENIAQKSEMILDSVVLTAPPAVDLSLQPGDGVFQRLVLLLLFLPLVLPLLGRQLHIQTHCVLDRLCPGETGRWANLFWISPSPASYRQISPQSHLTVFPPFIMKRRIQSLRSVRD